ncbi:DUF4398 domain-containing protein [Gilvimarinus polysaccharolyticus]|uniref:DUF4398 domain-containing protein n=1 Tax=Gilvimarinus polysaccharolyticus TaxID=863921 RepID=UPI000A06D58F|nr:DUF4398 domain-containing protein [Gilvimarinus polysaccharolyticus]
MRRIKTGFFTILMTVFALTACANNAPVPNILLSQAEAGVEQARSLNAEKHAPLALRDAKQNLDKANAAIAKKDNAKASQWLERSVADSDLAIAKSHAKKSERAADQVEENLRVLEQEVKNNQQ